MPPLRALPTVHSYYFPEVRALVSEMAKDFPHHVFLRGVDPGLEDFHVPIVDKLLRFHAPSVPALRGFANRYPTSGSEEGIREYLTLLASEGVRRAAAWQGEYEGYREVARTRGIEIAELPWDADPGSVPPTTWFLSNPSALDGNVVAPERIAAIAAAGHRIFYDLSYVGSTRPMTFDVAADAVDAAVVSFSLPYGLFHYRIGFTFTRRPVPALQANRWFKNVFSLLVADRLMDRLSPEQLPAKYRPIQEHVVKGIVRDTGLPLVPSDALLLAHIDLDAPFTEAQAAQVARFRRASGYRFCLTPYYQRAAG